MNLFADIQILLINLILSYIDHVGNCIENIDNGDVRVTFIWLYWFNLVEKDSLILRLQSEKVDINWQMKTEIISGALVQLKLSSAEQSTTWESSTADKAIDGTTDGIYDKEWVLSSIRLKLEYCFGIDCNVWRVPETDTLILFILGRTKEKLII